MNVKICLDCKKVNPEDSNYCCNCGNNTFMTEKEVEEYIKAAKDGNVVDLMTIWRKSPYFSSGMDSPK